MEDSIMSDLISSTNVDSAVAIKPEIFQQRRQPKQNRRGSYDPEPDYSAIMRRRFQEHDGGRRTARACDRCKVWKYFYHPPTRLILNLDPIHQIFRPAYLSKDYD